MMEGFSIPPGLDKVGIGALVLALGIALARSWIYTAPQVAKLLNSVEKVAELWEKVATTHQENNQKLIDSLDPLMQQNSAILKAVEDLQADRRYRAERDRGRR